MFKVMLRDNISSVAKEILEKTGQIEVTIDNDKKTNTPDQLSKIIADYDGIAVRSGSLISADVIEAGTRLKVIGRAGIGVDNIDVAAATRQGVVVMNAPGGNTVTTAEHTIAMLFAVARNIPQGTESIRRGRWEKKTLIGVEITSKTLGIIGLGQIGRIVAERALGLKMNVIAHDPYISDKAAKALNVKIVPLDDLLAQSDFITLHVPRLKETSGMINSVSIAKMKPGVRLINCSRGEIVDIHAVYQALESGHIAGVALDVFPSEPPDPKLPIITHPRAVFTPHLGASTGEAQLNVAEMIAAQMATFLIHDEIRHALNFPSLPRTVMDKIRPHLDLGEKMGALMGQLAKTIHDITITYCGDAAELETRPISHAVLKGYLNVFSGRPVNYVNAPELAKEKGIHIKETTHSARGDFSGYIAVKLENAADSPDEIWGTIFSSVHPRIVRLGEIYMDAQPEGYMLIIQNHDNPGVIGDIGTVLGKHHINIGRFQLGRRDRKALCIVNIDTPADDAVIHELGQLPNILYVKQVHL